MYCEDVTFKNVRLRFQKLKREKGDVSERSRNYVALSLFTS